MAQKLINKLLTFFGIDEKDEIEENEKLDLYEGKPKIINIHTQSQIKVIIIKPDKFEQAQNICTELKNKKPVIIDFKNMDKLNAQRLIDFISGAILALDGEIRKIDNNIFFIAPDNFDITGDIQDEVDSIYKLS